MRVLGLVLCAAASLAAAREPQQTRFVITKPTLISFFLDYTDQQVEEGDGGVNEALANFGYYLPPAETRLREAGIEVHSVFQVKSFQVKSGGRWRTVGAQKYSVGYYFVAPGREPMVVFGVDETEGILDSAGEYFRLKGLPRRTQFPDEIRTTPLPPLKFLITERGAGKVTTGMSKEEILRLYPQAVASAVGNADSPEIRIFHPRAGTEPAMRMVLDPDTLRVVQLDVLDKRFRSETNVGPGSTFGELLHAAKNLSLTQDADTWEVLSAGSCMTFQLSVDEATARRLGTEERIDWQHVVPAATPIRAVSLFASGCHIESGEKSAAPRGKLESNARPMSLSASAR